MTRVSLSTGLMEPDSRHHVDTLYVELTSRCNLLCAYCFNHSNEGLGTELTLTQALSAVSEARSLFATESVIVSGGEVLLYPRWREVIEHAQDLGARVDILTNALLTPDDALHFLRERGVGVSVSLGGTTPEQDEPLRGHGAWERTVRGMDRLVEAGLNPSITYVLHRHNARSMQQAVDFAAHHGVTALYFSLVRRLGRARQNWANLGLSLADRIGIVAAFQDLQPIDGVSIRPPLDQVLRNLVRRNIDRSEATAAADEHEERTHREVCLRYDGTVEDGNAKYSDWRSFCAAV